MGCKCLLSRHGKGRRYAHAMLRTSHGVRKVIVCSHAIRQLAITGTVLPPFPLVPSSCLTLLDVVSSCEAAHFWLTLMSCWCAGLLCWCRLVLITDFCKVKPRGFFFVSSHWSLFLSFTTSWIKVDVLRCLLALVGMLDLLLVVSRVFWIFWVLALSLDLDIFLL